MGKFNFQSGTFKARLIAPPDTYKTRELGDDGRLALRQAEFQKAYERAGRFRKPRVYPGTRVYPPSWFAERASTRDYIAQYVKLNHRVYMSPSIKPSMSPSMSPSIKPSIEWLAKQLSFFEPLSDRLTVPDGVDSVEPWDGFS